MADPATIVLVTKVAVTAATDKRTWRFLLSIVIGVVCAFILPFIVIACILSGGAESNRQVADIVFNGGNIPSDYSVELSNHIEEMQKCFKELDYVIDDINENLEKGSLDDIRIKASFFTLYFPIENLDFEESFYKDFINCFVVLEKDESEDESVIYSVIEDIDIIYSNISDLTGIIFTDIEKENINNLYLYIKYGYTSSTVVPGNTNVDWKNEIPPEALNDEIFIQLMNEATKYVGRPYVWGGSSPRTSFDCSGFVCWSYTQSGVYNLPRTTAQGIFNQCIPISKNEVKPGDLVFFTGTYSTSNPVTHIGIYIGNNKMLHAGDPIGYADLTESYWQRHFYAYGRLEN